MSTDTTYGVQNYTIMHMNHSIHMTSAKIWHNQTRSGGRWSWPVLCVDTSKIHVHSVKRILDRCSVTKGPVYFGPVRQNKIVGDKKEKEICATYCQIFSSGTSADKTDVKLTVRGLSFIW